jgi:hypothetical protein
MRAARVGNANGVGVLVRFRFCADEQSRRLRLLTGIGSLLKYASVRYESADLSTA